MVESVVSPYMGAGCNARARYHAHAPAPYRCADAVLVPQCREPCRTRPRSGDQFRHDIAGHVGETKAASLELVGEPLMVDAQQM